MKQIKEIQKITKQIVKNYKPKKIILFGSFAWGKPDYNSDVDLFIEKKTDKDPIKRSYELRKKLRSDLPLDILVYNPREIKQRLKINDLFIKQITERGKVLYEKNA